MMDLSATLVVSALVAIFVVVQIAEVRYRNDSSTHADDSTVDLLQCLPLTPQLNTRAMVYINHSNTNTTRHYSPKAPSPLLP